MVMPAGLSGAPRRGGDRRICGQAVPRWGQLSAAATPHSVLVAQRALEHLAAGVARQRLVAHRDVLRHLEVGEALRRSRRGPRRRRGRLPGSGTITAPTFSPIIVVGHADDRDLDDAGRARQRVLDLDAVHVLAAAVDHVLGAVDDVDEAVVVDRGRGRRCAASRRRTSPPSPPACSSSPARRSGPRISSSPTPVSGSGSSSARSTTGAAKPTESACSAASLVRQEGRDRGGLGEAEAVADPRVRERLLDACARARARSARRRRRPSARR